MFEEVPVTLILAGERGNALGLLRKGATQGQGNKLKPQRKQAILAVSLSIAGFLFGEGFNIGSVVPLGAFNCRETHRGAVIESQYATLAKFLDVKKISAPPPSN